MNDQRASFTVVVFAGLVVLAVVLGGIYLAAADKTLSGELIALGGAALGLLGGVLSPSPFRQTVEIAQPADRPVPVEEQP